MSILSMDKSGEQKSLGRLSFTVHLMFGLAEASAVTDNLSSEGKRSGHSALTKSASCGLKRKSRSILFMENPIRQRPSEPGNALPDETASRSRDIN